MSPLTVGTAPAETGTLKLVAPLKSHTLPVAANVPAFEFVEAVSALNELAAQPVQDDTVRTPVADRLATDAPPFTWKSRKFPVNPLGPFMPSSVPVVAQVATAL